MRKDRPLLLALAALLALFAWGLFHLFQLRFETGDVYPPYSSLRSDPLGTKALYEGLDNLHGLEVQRFIQRLDKLPGGRKTALLVLGADASDMERSTLDEYRKLEQFMFDGGRIVISFAPLNTRPWTARRPQGTKPTGDDSSSDNDPKKNRDPQKGDPQGRRRPDREREDDPNAGLIALRDRWNVDFGYENLPKDAAGDYESVRARKMVFGNLPDSIIWHTALYFDKAGTNWNVVFARDRRPVLIERRFGRGALVLSADSYFLSNEAMRGERHPELLSWLIGPNAIVLFDETHLGVIEAPGVAALVRKYHLAGLVLGLLLLAGLFVWKNAVRFVPGGVERAADAPVDAVAGKESAAGFLNLLRRSVPPSELLAVCLKEWKRARAHGRTDLNARIDRAAAALADEQGLPVRERNAVETYRRISRILTERK